jgi:hypothetical protein
MLGNNLVKKCDLCKGGIAEKLQKQFSAKSDKKPCF